MTAVRIILAVASRLPYALFLFLVLAPAGVLAYSLAALAAAVWSNLKTGWSEHR